MPAQGGRDPGTVGRRGTRRGVRFLEGSTVDSREIGFTDLCVCVCTKNYRFDYVVGDGNFGL